jgi:hypothetical protein
MTQLMDASVVPIRALSLEEALTWLRSNSTSGLSNADLARAWGWNDVRVGRRLKAWERGGQIARSPSGIVVREPSGRRSSEVAIEEAEQLPAVVETPVVVEAPAHCATVDRVYEAPRGSWGHRAVAYLTAVALTSVAGYFSVTGMPELFPGAPVAVMVLAGTMEGAKLVLAGFLAHEWPELGVLLRLVLVALTVGLAGINGAGIFGRLAEAHVGVAAASASAVDERLGSLDARISAQRAAVVDFERRVAQVDGAVEEATRRGRTGGAMALATSLAKQRGELAAGRQREAKALADLEGDRAGLVAERRRVEAGRGPIVFLAAIAGVDVEVAIRWLMLLIVLCCDPAAIALTIAASRRH